LKKFLLDENIDPRIEEYESSNYLKSVCILGPGVPDEQVFNYAKKHNLIVVTRDIRFAFHMILSGHKTVFVETPTNKTTLVDPKIDVNPKYSSPITEYLQRTNSIIIP